MKSLTVKFALAAAFVVGAAGMASADIKEVACDVSSTVQQFGTVSIGADGKVSGTTTDRKLENIGVVSGDLLFNNAQCVAPQISVAFDLRNLDRMTKELNGAPTKDVMVVIDFNGAAENIDIPVFDGSSGDFNGFEFTRLGAVFFDVENVKVLDSATIEKIKKSGGIAFFPPE